ncbi:hypothetical protein [Nocardia sp. NPDC057227]|uniref:hypothetical protein n=1 Tax=Nocardia sp. NPDC057227 TaxID=3346056 RepID=UPI003624CA30
MIVEKWTAVEVRALRTAALRETQEEFAERLGWGDSTIRAWERAGTGRTVRAGRAEALDTVLRELTTEQAARFAAALALPRPAPPVHPGTAAGRHAAAIEEDTVRRRDFGKLAAFTAATLPAWDTQHAATRIGVEDVRRLASAVDELLVADQHVGGAPLVDAAAATLDRTLALLHTSSFDGATGRAFMAATADLAVVTGWLAHDTDRHALARRCYSDAASLASAADDTDIAAHAYLNSANQALTLARTGRGSSSYALTLVGRARDLMRGRPPGRIHALIATREAQVYGVAGDHEGFGRAIATAWRELDAAVNFEPDDEVPLWLRFVSASEIRALEARGYNDLGDLPRALTLYEVTCSEFAQPRNALNDRAWLAATRAAIGDAAGALEDGTPVLAALAESVRSPRTLNALAPVRAAAEDAPGGADFVARFDTLAAMEGAV